MTVPALTPTKSRIASGSSIAFATRSMRTAAGSASSASWKWRCTSRASATTARVRSSSVAMATSSRAGDLAAIQPLSREPMHRSHGPTRRDRHPRARCRLGRHGRRHSARARRARALARALSDSRSQRRSARASARDDCGARARATGRVSVARCMAYRACAASCSRTKCSMRCPSQRFRIRGSQVNAIGVTWQLGRLDWSETHAIPHSKRAVRAIETAAGEALARWLLLRTQSAARRRGCKAWPDRCSEGVALFIDYGLPRASTTAPNAREGTLLCHYRHRFHDDPLINVGVQDIGAWVDFTAVAEAASDAGFSVAGFTTQAHFLIGCGIEQYLAIARRGRNHRSRAARATSDAADASRRNGRALQSDRTDEELRARAARVRCEGFDREFVRGAPALPRFLSSPLSRGKGPLTWAALIPSLLCGSAGDGLRERGPRHLNCAAIGSDAIAFSSAPAIPPAPAPADSRCAICSPVSPARASLRQCHAPSLPHARVGRDPLRILSILESLATARIRLARENELLDALGATKRIHVFEQIEQRAGPHFSRPCA